MSGMISLCVGPHHIHLCTLKVRKCNLHSSVLILLSLLMKVKKLNYCDVLYSVIIILMHIEGK